MGFFTSTPEVLNSKSLNKAEVEGDHFTAKGQMSFTLVSRFSYCCASEFREEKKNMLWGNAKMTSKIE